MTAKFRYYLASLIGRFRSEIVMSTRYGFRFKADPTDLVGRFVFTFGVWEPNLTDFIVERVRPGTRFIDVGANFGYYSLLAARRGARVTAIEAAPDMARRTQDNMAREGLPGDIINAAATAEEGEVTLYESFSRFNTGARSIVADDRAVYARVRGAPIASLVDFSGEEEFFVKIDIEGSERPVLEDLAEIIAADPALRMTMVVELSRDNMDLIPRFQAAGCRIRFLKNDYTLDSYIHYPGHYLMTEFGAPPPEPYETVFETAALVAAAG